MYHLCKVTFADGGWYRFVTKDLDARKVIDREDAARDIPWTWYGRVLRDKGEPIEYRLERTYKNVSLAIKKLLADPIKSGIQTPPMFEPTCEEDDDFEYSHFDDEPHKAMPCGSSRKPVCPKPWLSEEAGEMLEAAFAAYPEPHHFFWRGPTARLLERAFRATFVFRHQVHPMYALYHARQRMVSKAGRIAVLGDNVVLEMTTSEFYAATAPWLLDRFEMLAKKVLGGLPFSPRADREEVIARAATFLRHLYGDDGFGSQKSLGIPSKMATRIKEIMERVDPSTYIKLSKVLFPDENALSGREVKHLNHKIRARYREEQFQKWCTSSTTPEMLHDVFKHQTGEITERMKDVAARVAEERGWDLPDDA